MSYRYYACDVFTERLFGGNPLAVLNPVRISGYELWKIGNNGLIA